MRFRDRSVVQLEVRGEHLLLTLDYSMPCLCDWTDVVLIWQAQCSTTDAPVEYATTGAPASMPWYDECVVMWEVGSPTMLLYILAQTHAFCSV